MPFCTSATKRIAWFGLWFACAGLLGCPDHPQLDEDHDGGGTSRDVPDDPLIAQSWHLGSRLRASGVEDGSAGGSLYAVEAWEISQGQGQLIAILDSGIDLSHPDLRIAPGYDFADDDDDPGPDLYYDDYPHGTAMAGIAAAIGGNGIGTAGVAPAAQVLPVKIVGRNQSFDALAKAVTYAVHRGAAVISNSWGDGNDHCAKVELPAVFSKAIDYAESHGRDGLGAVVVFSIGNGGCDVADNQLLADERLVVVGATDATGKRVSYSNMGDALDLMGPSGSQLDGEGGLWTTDVVGVLGYDNLGDYFGHATGTSAAAAAVSGVFALMFAANPHLTAAQARAIACETAIADASDAELRETGRSRAYGCGRVSALSAVTLARELSAPVP